MASWYSLPAEIRALVLELLSTDGCSLAGLATVSREWQMIIERHTFTRIKLTPSRLASFGSMTRRNRALVRYIWLCLELQEYDCSECSPEGPEEWLISISDNLQINTAFQDLFATLSTWEPNGNLLLDISVHSPSDSEHWFKYLTFEPDIPSGECDQRRDPEQSMLAKLNDQRHSWMDGRRASAPPVHAMLRLFKEVMGSSQRKNPWRPRLPLVPAVTGVLLRQQTRRRWNLRALCFMFACLPRLEEVHFEPWVEWSNDEQVWTDRYFQTLLESLNFGPLRRLILFENSDPQYLLDHQDFDPVRASTSRVSRAVANASLNLEHLSASFMVDARYFFNARRPSWKWANLTWLALTSRLLVPYEDLAEIDDMLQVAAAAAMEMQKLDTMEIWNGLEGIAMLFKYQRAEGGELATITTRGTWKLALRPPVLRAWRDVAHKHRCSGTDIVEESLEVGDIESHGDAIHHLKLSRPVIRPISLRQIRMEHRIRKGQYS
ncbi:hypothetical protein V8C42DRAFT_358365 [Trichoderma barbatum]